MNIVPDKLFFGFKRFTYDLNGKSFKINSDISLSKNINIGMND
ncbi:hypothetical protein [Fluviispira sanaruensis]|nr:hypothetical protein [Fluviispira sanaruensis]